LQIRTLREYAARRGWTIALQVKEVGSGASQRQLQESLLEAARRREIDVVLVWRLDRWGRSVTICSSRAYAVVGRGGGLLTSQGVRF
jgi:DNA invertase Pin-like site-specific DNA recombinase